QAQDKKDFRSYPCLEHDSQDFKINKIEQNPDIRTRKFISGKAWLFFRFDISTGCPYKIPENLLMATYFQQPGDALKNIRQVLF
ncbi:MAG TPA: hypothetical protein DCQ37_20550, partial [Desulfobacteraceae bacterium]|nr:hypothetical protein [Desulfobacteraceae bacterium]